MSREEPRQLAGIFILLLHTQRQSFEPALAGFSCAKSKVEIAAIPDPNTRASSPFSKAATLLATARWLGTLKYRG